MKTIFRICRKTSMAALLLVLPLAASRAQSPLEGYIREGLENNIVLQQKNIVLEKAMYSLKEANSLFLPSLNFNASYLSGEGGRYFNFPVGDLLNPVYQTLNQMTNSSSFPQVSNQEAYLNPYNYHDAHVRASLPLLNTDIYYNKSIQKEQAALQEYEVDIYKRELVKNIRNAYYNYLLSLSAVRIYESALELVNRNVQVNESLLQHGKGLPASVLRSQSESEKIQTELLAAQNQAVNAKQYFNFLLNRALDSSIDTSFNADEALKEAGNYLNRSYPENREELLMTRSGTAIYSSQLKLSNAYWIPKINTFIDLGTQATEWTLNSKSQYYLFGVQMDIPLFHGFRNQYKASRSRLDLKSAQLNEKNVAQQLQLSTDMAKNSLASVYKEYQTAQKEQQSAQSYYKLIETGYREGSNSLIEYIDARNQLTSSTLKVTMTTYRVLQAMAGVERETASYELR